VSPRTSGARRVVVVGLGMTGDAVVRWSHAAGDDTIVVEDRVATIAEARLAAAREAGVPVIPMPEGAAVAPFLAGTDLVVPSPGVPDRHPFVVAARRAGIPVRAEVDLGAELLAARGRTLIAVTGTNGKTTVTELTVAMLQAGGVPAVAAGNIGAPLLDEAGRLRPEVVVAEVSSFQLAAVTDAFRPRAAVLCNIADDHLDWHRTFEAYAHAKAKVFAHQGPDDTLVYNADDPVVSALAASAPGRTRAFTVAAGAAGYRVIDGAGGRRLVSDDDEVLAEVADLPAAAPHDLANALAAAALVRAVGAPTVGVGEALRSFVRGGHRLGPVAEIDGVRFVDDSKATNVHAALAAMQSFDRVVLLAGGRNKGLDLAGLRAGVDHLVAVVAIGEAAGDVVAAFRGTVPVEIATSMESAVDAAIGFARPGDVVLLSPACASFDWYGSYAERGDDFARIVHRRAGVAR